jgi:hypothetical protein
VRVLRAVAALLVVIAFLPIALFCGIVDGLTAWLSLIPEALDVR